MWSSPARLCHRQVYNSGDAPALVAEDFVVSRFVHHRWDISRLVISHCPHDTAMYGGVPELSMSIPFSALPSRSLQRFEVKVDSSCIVGFVYWHTRRFSNHSRSVTRAMLKTLQGQLRTAGCHQTLAGARCVSGSSFTWSPFFWSACSQACLISPILCFFCASTVCGCRRQDGTTLARALLGYLLFRCATHQVQHHPLEHRWHVLGRKRSADRVAECCPNPRACIG